MRQVSSPTCHARAARGARLWSRALGASAAMALTLVLSATPVAATDDLIARQQQVRLEAETARAELEADTASLGAASQALLESQARLAEAQARLSDTQVQLQGARADDARLAARLAEEQAQLRRDEAEVALAQARVDAQQALIAQTARDAYQQQSNLAGLGVLLGAETTDEFAQRVQWDTTVFDSSQAKLDELDVLRGRLQEARDRQAATAAAVEADRQESARTVARVAALVGEAERLQAEVAALVAQNEADRQAAQAELDADQARYDELMAEDARVSQELMALAAARARYVTSVAAGQVWTDPATYPLLASGPQVAVSQKGFTRPVAARPGSAFGQRLHPILRVWRLHRGTDFGATCGTPLFAAQAGRVARVGPQGGFGNYTIIDHGEVDGVSVMTGYAHQERWVVAAGQLVTQGQLIGYVGSTGLSTTCHLHLQVYVEGGVANPLAWIP